MSHKGTERLLRDIQIVERVLDDRRAPARERLRALIGDALADRLFSLITVPLRRYGRPGDERRETA